MTFSEKLRKLRKEKGLSQEDLANELNISRQAVSKWESGQGFPETDKIIQISTLLGTSIDYLLKDNDPAFETTAEIDNIPEGYYVSRETTEGFLEYKKKFASRLALAVSIIILGLVPFFLLENYNEAYSIVAFFVFVIVGVGMILLNAFQPNRYKDMEEKPLIFDPTLLSELKERFMNERKNYGIMIVAGVITVIIGVVFASIIESLPAPFNNDAMMSISFILWAAAVYTLIIAGSALGSRDMLVNNRKHINERENDAQLGWLFGIAAMIFLLVGFLWNAWHPGWIIFPITGILVGGLSKHIQSKG